MADISDINAAQSVKLIGATSDGTEETPIGSSVNREILASDTANSPGGGLTATIALTTTPVEGKVGGAPKPDRKYIIMEALSTNVKWGFTAGAQPFDLFKSQVIIFPAGPNTHLWFKMSSSTGNLAFGEA